MKFTHFITKVAAVLAVSSAFAQQNEWDSLARRGESLNQPTLSNQHSQMGWWSDFWDWVFQSEPEANPTPPQSPPAPTPVATVYDVVVYGGSSSGVMAAVQASKMGKSVALVVPEKSLGGMTSNGLGWIDVANPAIIGGLTKEFFSKVWKHYQAPEAWIFEPKRDIKGQLKKMPKDGQMWVVEPHVAEQIFQEMASQPNLYIVQGERLNRSSGVIKNGAQIVEIQMESGKTFHGKVFIDATYEGDLMAAAHVSYTVQREGNSLYGETLNGVRHNTKGKNPDRFIDPYLIAKNPQSGLLPRVSQMTVLNDGEEAVGIQAYNYRMCLTDVSENRVMIEKPEGYDEKDYELLFRAIEAGIIGKEIFKFDLLPNRKTDSNNNGIISTDFVGMNWDYPEADYATREQIAIAHEKWQRGLVWSLQNHPRVPEEIRNHYVNWGLAKDEFIDNNHWPRQLYVREARRMVSDFVVTEKTVLGQEKVFDSIGIGAYQMDSHSVKYIATKKGHLATEGGMYSKVKKPFLISYQAIVPKRSECTNLLVSICLSASHAAYGSVRMEPTFMVLGQSAAIAAVIALENHLAVQDVPYVTLKDQLIQYNQIIE